MFKFGRSEIKEKEIEKDPDDFEKALLESNRLQTLAADLHNLGVDELFRTHKGDLVKAVHPICHKILDIAQERMWAAYQKSQDEYKKEIG